MREATRRKSQMQSVWKRLRRNKLAMVGLVIVALLILITVFANCIAPYSYDGIDVTATFEYPNLKHLLGTDNFGRDLLSRIIYGGRISLLVAVLAVVLALCSGGFLGAVAGFYGGLCERIIMSVMDILMAIPSFLLAVSVSAALGSGIMNTAIAIAIGAVPSYARIVRASVLTIRESEYVQAAYAGGVSDMRIIFRHILPNTLSPIIVESTLRIGACILQISSLSFIGLGVRPPTPEWGSIMSSGLEYIRSFWPIVTFPGVAILLTLFGFNLLGDGLRDALDPRLKR